MKDNNIEWLKIKHGHISGSEISVLLGSNKYKSPLDLYREKTEPLVLDRPQSIPARRGKQLEELVLTLYAEETGNTLLWNDGVDRFHPHAKIPYIGCSPDNIATSMLNTSILVEAKTAAGRGVFNWSDGVPDSYKQQVIWNIGIECSIYPELESVGDVPALLDNEFKIFTVEFTKDVFDTMVDIALDFWKNNVQKLVPPKASAVADWNEYYRKAEAGRYIEIDSETVKELKHIEHLKSELKKSEKALAEISASAEDTVKFIKDRLAKAQLELREKIGRAEGLSYNGVPIVSCKNGAEKTSFDMEKFILLHPDIHAKFIKRNPGARTLRTLATSKVAIEEIDSLNSINNDEGAF